MEWVHSDTSLMASALDQTAHVRAFRSKSIFYQNCPYTAWPESILFHLACFYSAYLETVLSESLIQHVAEHVE